MADRFQNAQWYIGGGDELNTIIYDASDLFSSDGGRLGDGPDGHGMVCQDAVIEDARLRAAAVDLLAVAQRVVAMEPGSAMSTLYAAQAAIAKAEGRE